MLKKLKLLKDWTEFKAGSIIEADAEVAKTLIASQSAEEFVEKTADKQDIDEKLDEKIQKGVTEALKDYSKKNKTIQIQVTRNEGDEGFRSLGEQLIAVKNLATEGKMDKRLQAIMTKAAGGASGASVAIDSDGGFLVQQDFQTEIFQIMNETGILSRRCSNTPIGPNSNGLVWNAVDETSRVDGSRKGGLSVYRTAEAATKNSSKPKFARREMRLMKLTGLFYATDELLEDATALSSMVQEWFPDEFGYVIDDEIYRGTGSGQMLGILNSGALVTVNKETGQTPTTIVAQNIIKMYSRLHAKSIGKAEWYINQDILPQLFTMSITVGTGGQLIYMPANGLSQAPYGTLFGRPVTPIEQASTLGTVGDIVFADLSQYKLINKGGVKTDSSIHVRFINDETTFRFVVRNNGQPLWRTPITPAQGSNTQSPFVALQTRS